MMMKDDLIEALADIEHQRWSDWQKYLHGQCEREPVQMEQPDGSWTFGSDFIIPCVMADRWERQIATPYADLSEREKASDRAQVARYWPLIVEFLAEWLEQLPLDFPMALQISDRWREEMT